MTSLTPVTPASDAPTEKTIFLSWGKLANTMEELVDDLVEQSPLLINTFGLGTPIYNQLLTLNSTFFVRLPYMSFQLPVLH